MSTLPRATGERTEDPLRGKTVRWTFEDGPTAGTTFEHRFSPDGTVEYRAVGAASGTSTQGQRKPAAAAPLERKPTRYVTRKAAPDVFAVSYLAASGYTLTVVLNFTDHRMVGFASNDKEWFVQQGSFEIVD